MLTKDQDISHPLRYKGTTPHRPLSMTKSRIASDARGLEHRLAVRVVKGQGFAMKCTLGFAQVKAAGLGEVFRPHTCPH